MPSAKKSYRKSSTSKLTALVDGDIYIFKAAAVVEKAVNWGGDLWTLHANLSDAQEIIEEKLESIKTETGADKLIVALSDITNFRYSVYPLYKSNRKDKRPPLLREVLKQWMLETYETFLRPGLEADDVLGILGTSTVIVKGKKIVVSEDKDLKTIPGRLYNTRSKEFTEVSEADADRQHMIQTLTGDASDGYPGCPGVGEVGAERLLKDVTGQDLWPTVVKAYEKAGLTEQDALIQAQIARICRKEDYDFKKKEVILWKPQ